MTYVVAKIRTFQILQRPLHFVLMPPKFVKQITMEILDVKNVKMVNVPIMHLFVTLRAGNVVADKTSLTVIQIVKIIGIYSLQTPALVMQIQICLLVDRLEMHVTLDL